MGIFSRLKFTRRAHKYIRTLDIIGEFCHSKRVYFYLPLESQVICWHFTVCTFKILQVSTFLSKRLPQTS